MQRVGTLDARVEILVLLKSFSLINIWNFEAKISLMSQDTS